MDDETLATRTNLKPKSSFFSQYPEGCFGEPSTSYTVSTCCPRVQRDVDTMPLNTVRLDSKCVDEIESLTTTTA